MLHKASFSSLTYKSRRGAEVNSPVPLLLK
nr:MAG TPA: hypothetical protein [Caudoviricetes sp.]